MTNRPSSGRSRGTAGHNAMMQYQSSRYHRSHSYDHPTLSKVELTAVRGRMTCQFPYSPFTASCKSSQAPGQLNAVNLTLSLTVPCGDAADAHVLNSSPDRKAAMLRHPACRELFEGLQTSL